MNSYDSKGMDRGYPYTSVASTPVAQAAANSQRVGAQGVTTIIYRNLWLIILTILLIMALAAAIIFNLEKRFSAFSTIVLEPASATSNLPVDSFDTGDLTRTQVETELNVIRSREFAARVAEALNLFSDPTFNPYLTGEADVSANGADQREVVIGNVLATYAVFRSGESLALNIVTSHTDPNMAANIANTVATEYIARSLEIQRSASSASVEFLSRRVQTIETELARSEIALATFIRQNELDDQELSEELRAALERVSSILDISVRNNEDAASIANLRAELEQVETQLNARTRAELGRMNMERALETERSRYQTFAERLNEIEAQQEILAPRARQISVAEPPRKPSWPNTNTSLALSFVGALGVAFVATLFREGGDRRIWSEEHAVMATGLPNIGSLPRLNEPNMSRPLMLDTYIAENPRSQFTEAVRALLTQIENSRQRDGCQVLMVTSGLPNEGKSTITLSLAKTLATEGMRVLILDLDTPRRGVSRLLGLPDSKYSMVDLWKNHLLLRSRIKHNLKKTGTAVLNFRKDTIPPRNLAADPKSQKIWNELRLQYDMILLDTPPVLLVDVATRMAGLAEGVVMVARWGRTTIDSLRDSAELLQSSDIRLIGTIINDVDLKKQARYGYGGYASYYIQGKEYYA